VITRPNEGYDFFSYRGGSRRWATCGDRRADDPQQLLRLPGSADAHHAFLLEPQPDIDVLGITSNYEYAAHVQSYWMSFETRRVLDSGAFASFWRTCSRIGSRSR
jgi:hypothetical protein